VYSSSQGCHTATGTHMPHGITQCYLPPGRSDIPALTPAEVGTRLSDPGGMQGWVDLVGLLHTEMVYPNTVTHPGTNRARRALTSFIRRTPLTTTPRRQRDAYSTGLCVSVKNVVIFIKISCWCENFHASDHPSPYSWDRRHYVFRVVHLCVGPLRAGGWAETFSDRLDVDF